MKRYVGVKAVLVMVAIVALVLVGCEGPEPTVSPIAAPGGQVAAAQARAQEPLSAELVAAFVAAAISVVLEVVPGLAAAWDKVSPEYKRLAWLVGCLMVPMAVLGAGCLGLDLGAVPPACDRQGVVEALKVGFAAYFAGQATFAVVGQAVRKFRRRGVKARYG